MSADTLRNECALAFRAANMQAFALLVRKGEGTLGLMGYKTLFGGEHFDSFADHPRRRITRKLGGKPITSTAAGAYQFLERTWDECQKILALPDFSPASQDIAFVFLVRRRGALQDVLAGRIDRAIAKCSLEWASLPGSPYGQPTQRLQDAIAMYLASGGILGDSDGPGNGQDGPQAPSGGAGGSASTPEPSEAATGPSLPPEQRFPPAPPDDPVRPSPDEAQSQLVTEDRPMAPLIAGLAGILMEAFTPLAKEKLSQAIAKTTKTPEVADRIAATIVDTAKVVAGSDDPLKAVDAIRANPELIAQVEKMTLAEFDQLIPLVERMRAIDEKSVQTARDFNRDAGHFIDFGKLRLTFVQFLSLGLISFSGWFATVKWDTLTEQFKGAVITLMIISGYVGVRDYWMGSSEGSQRKTDEIIRRSKHDA